MNAKPKENSRKILFSFALTICLAAAAGLASHSAAGAGAPVLVADKGKFSIEVDGKAVGSESFEIAQAGAEWVARGSTEVNVAGAPETHVTGNLRLQPDGSPIAYEWSSRAEKTNGAHIAFTNGVAKITLEMQGARPFEQDLTFNAPLISVLDNNLYHQYALLARIYDWSKRGAQTFPVLIPQDLTPGTITVEATGPAEAGGKSYEGLRVSTSDLEVLLMLDSNHKLMRLEVPSAKVAVIRQ
jgi:hypothetical protein